MRVSTRWLVPMIVCLALAACGRGSAPDAGKLSTADSAAQTAPATPTAPFAWPASLQPFGEGYPNPGDPCRRIGESAAVADLLDHTRVLVGCPGRADEAAAAAVLADGQGKALAYIDGVTLIAVPPNASM